MSFDLAGKLSTVRSIGDPELEHRSRKRRAGICRVLPMYALLNSEISPHMHVAYAQRWVGQGFQLVE